MRAGELRWRVTIQARTVAASAVGQPVETWADAYSSWAAREALSGSEREVPSDQRLAGERWRWTLRRRSGVTISPGAHRLVCAGRAHNIISALEHDETGFCGWIVETETERR